MSETVFDEANQRVNDFELAHLHTPEEWRCFFEDATRLLDHPDHRIKDYAIDRLQKGIWSENGQVYRQPGFTALPAESRLPPILDAILRQDRGEHQLLHFTKWSSFNDDQREIFSDWLAIVEARGSISAETAATAKLQAELYSTNDWASAKSFLEPFFNHANDLLRAASAAAYGEMYCSGADNLPPLSETMQQVKEWEIERPGFAGPFVGQLLMNTFEDGEIEGSGVKLEDWILEIIAKRKSDEPDVPFYNGIDFHAHEILSCNPIAVGKLIDFGAEAVAAMAATEENQPIDGMKEHLERLAHSRDEFVSRICSWHLAYNYRCLHPEGERRNYVGLVQREDVDVFLVFDPIEHGIRPYAATIYPRESTLQDHIAWKWIDKLVPPDMRPPMEDNHWAYKTPRMEPRSATYAYGSYIITLYGDTQGKNWDRVWVKWPLDGSRW